MCVKLDGSTGSASTRETLSLCMSASSFITRRSRVDAMLGGRRDPAEGSLGEEGLRYKRTIEHLTE